MADGYLNFDTKINTNGMSEGLSKLAGMAKSACRAAASSIAAAGGALAGLAAKAVQVGTSFEASMSQVAATMGITAQEIAAGSKEYEILARAAKDAGASTKYSATQAADALNYLALAGYDAKTSADVLPSVLNLAAASGMELAAASDLATDAMSALGIAASSKNLTAFGDKLAKTASKSNTSVSQLGEAILKCAGTAKGFGMSTETLTAELGVLANRGLKSAEAGTHLRNIILALESPTSSAAKELKRLGIEATNSDGSFRDMNEIVGDLDKSMSKMTSKKRAESLSKIFNKTDLEAVNYLMAGLGEEYNSLYREVSDCDGAMQDMADTMNDNLQGQVTILQSALEGLGIQVYEGLEKPLKHAATEATEAVGRLASAFKKGGFHGLTEAIGGELASAAAKVSEYAPQLADAGTDLLLSLIRGMTDNSDRLASAGIKVGKAIVGGIVTIAPQAAAAGLEIAAALAKSIVGAKPAREIKKLASTVKKSFKEIASAVKSSTGSVKNLLGNLITISAKVINAGIKPLTKAVVLLTKHGKPLVTVLAASAAAMKANAAATAVTAKIKVLTAVVTKSKKAWAEAKAMMALFTTAEEIASIKTQVLNGSLTGYEVIAGVVTGKIKLATLAQAAWNAITAANPFVLAATALAALGAGIAAYCLMSDKAKSKSDEYFDATMKSIEGVEGFKSVMDEAVPSLASYDSLLSASGRTIADLDSAIDKVESSITDILSRAVKDQKAIRDEDIENIRHYTQQLYDLQQEKLELYRSQQLAELRKIELEKGKIDKESAAQHIANLQETLTQSNQIVEDAYTAELTLIENKHNAGLYKDNAAYQEALEQAKQSHDDRLAENQSFYDQGYAQIQEGAAKWTEADAQMWQDMSDSAQELNQIREKIKNSGWEYFDSSKAEKILDDLHRVKDEVLDNLSQIDPAAAKAASSLLQFAVSTKESGQQVSDSVKASADTILNAFDGLPEEMQENGRDILLGLIKGYGNEIPGLEDAANMSAQEIVDTLRAYLDINSPSKVTAEIGGYAGEGLAKGMENASAAIKTAAEKAGQLLIHALNVNRLKDLALSAGKAVGTQLGTGIPQGIKSKLDAIKNAAVNAVNAAISAAKSKKGGDIHSPSRKTRDKIGKPLIQGIGVGMDKEAYPLARKAAETTNDIVARMRAAVAAESAYVSGRGAISHYNTSNTTTNNYSTSNNYNPTLNFYREVETPSQAARAWRRAMEVTNA